MGPPNSRDTKIKQEMAMNSLPPIITWALENYKLPKLKDLYKALYKIYVISTKHNTIKSY